ncbi:Exo endo phos domain containing protein [Trichuris trichiura]|uniref:Exo endo phos domain containing protein n=1 Tax=Trichuris trichiura TaxID=36087 RepID=A0A077YZ15_TRITR|nr:Exo endo phos domain containing protein [Trichuris trichiura]
MSSQFVFTMSCLLVGWSLGLVTESHTREHWKPSQSQSIVIMTFNIWNSGANVEDGLFKIAKHILYVYPDIVALQEVMATGFLNIILRHLGPEWTAAEANDSYPDVAILTRHKIVSWSDWVADGHAWPAGYMWAHIRISRLEGHYLVNFWNVHLDWRDYGPYAACNKLVTKAEQIDAGEWGTGRPDFGRAQQISLLVNSKAFVQHLSESNTVPLFLAGDLNSPSHLDWTRDTKWKNCDWVYAWPTTLQLIKVGLKDSYREIYPNPLTQPGLTWSTVRKGQEGWNGTIPEPQERIDMIFYKSSVWYPTQVVVYNGYKNIVPYPDHYKNDWPSDHYAVVAQFSNAMSNYLKSSYSK